MHVFTSLDYFLPLGVPFAKIVTCISFNKTSAKRESMFSATFIAREIFPKVSQVCHAGILSRIRACEQWQKFCEHEQGSTHLTFASNSSNGQALRALLSLVFICRENPRRSGILLFPDRPRFCRLMKTRNRRYPRSSGVNGDKSRESGAFLFSRRVPDFCDGRRSFPTNENSNLYSRGHRRPSAMDFAHYQSPKLLGYSPISQIITASLENLGQSSGEYPIYRQNLG